MIEHGIRTSQADYWLHFFPLEPAVYWYRVAHALEFVRLEKTLETIGRSKDGTATGAGFLVPKTAFFVMTADVPQKVQAAKRWHDLTDRELGFFGELAVQSMIEARHIRFSNCIARPLRSASEQYNGQDLRIEWLSSATVEIKTERRNTGNLFVQTREGGHRVHQVRTFDGCDERVTEAPTFDCSF